MSQNDQVTLTHLKCEYKTNPLGLDTPYPRLSWQVQAKGRGVRQTAYQIRAAHCPRCLQAGDLLWDSGQVASGQSIHIPYGGPALASGQRVYWQARVWVDDGPPSAWSEPAWWEMGLLGADDWTAQWIEPDLDEDVSVSNPCPMLRKAFDVQGEVASARLYVTAHGLYEAELNGQAAGDQVLTPGWTVYPSRLQYQTYDVTAQLLNGENAIGVTLADGWYRGFLGFSGQRNVYGERLALLLQLKIEYADGRVQWVVTDDTWRAGTGPILAADIYNGESYDARLEKPGWSGAGFDDHSWAGVKLVSDSQEILCAPAGPPVRRIQELRPTQIIHTPAGETVFDMGQNMVGWVRLQAQGTAGDTITLRHAEVLDQQGNIYYDNLRSACQTDTYTLKGGEAEIWQPRFTFHGFRYVAVSGYPGTPTLDSLAGIVVHSDMVPTSEWECDDPLLNQLQHNIVWGQKGNFVDVPTDCPQRDERLGWTGDAQAFIRTACFNMDVAGFFTKWLRDLAADQSSNGSVPFVVPNVLGRGMGGASGSAAWGDAATICPWTIYLCYGDTRLLEEQYPSMQAWVGYIEKQAGENGLWNTGFHFGDWLSYNSPDPGGSSAITDRDLIATAFFAYSTHLTLQAAQVLGKTQDIQHYTQLLERIRAAFLREFVTPNGRVANNTQTAYVLALMFDLLPPDLRPEAAGRLAADVRRRGNHLSTGFVGTPYLCHVLSRNGQLETAYNLLNQDTYPSWLYPVKMGATTIWERWDGIKPDGSFQDASMNSYNHYAYGAIGEWMYSVVTGLDVDPTAPGYRHVLVQPQPGGELEHVRASIHSMYGLVACEWTLQGDDLHLNVTVPPNTTATVRIPYAQSDCVSESGLPLSQVAGVNGVAQDGSTLVIEVGSGQYCFLRRGSPGAPPARGFSIDSSLGDLLSSKKAKAVLLKHIPDLLSRRQFGMGMDMSLSGLAARMPHLLDSEKLEQIDQDLKGLSI